MVLLLLALGLAYRGVYALYGLPYRPEVLGAAASNGVNPLLLVSVMRVESKFDPTAVSRDGAIGLLQLTPATAAWVAGQRGSPVPFRGGDLYDPAYNIAAGAWYLAHLAQAFGGRWAPAVAAYSAGPTPVALWLRTGTWDGSRADADAIPFPETRLFVQRVLGAYAIYRVLYPALARAVADPGRVGAIRSTAPT